MERAKELYREKYKELIKAEFDVSYSKEERDSSSLLQAIRHYYDLAGNKGLSFRNWMEMLKTDWRILFVAFGTWMGLVEKDWRILVVARFVSKMDFLINMTRPYYLVQSIPRPFLQKLSAVSHKN
jgi:hypothetical protein